MEAQGYWRAKNSDDIVLIYWNELVLHKVN